ncbi:hypothetical protein BGX31_001871 [Mortierella sp. GBA43]|nr:hypothetical protein BGX31_001871 [Mortierella sp. GBA43]
MNQHNKQKACTNHLLGWYSDQRIGQRIRDTIKEREMYVQEALEKMAGEEYARVKRRSQQFQQQRQQQQQQQQHGNPYGQRYQQQYQQQREQRQREKEREREKVPRDRDQEKKKEGLSPAEWQELIQAASISFMSKFTASPARGPRR